MKHRLELPKENFGLGWYVVSIANNIIYLRKDLSTQIGTGFETDNCGYWDTYEQAFQAREAYLSKWTRPTHEEEYVGMDNRYTEEKEDQAFEELEKKLNLNMQEERKQFFDSEGYMADDKTILDLYLKRPKVEHFNKGSIEAIDYINAHDFNFNLGNAIKYITRCNYKGTKKEDLKKAIDYINFELERDK